MPTGYTYFIDEGISFEKFVMICAREFGACGFMCDEPMDAEIPDEFKPDDYYAKRLRETRLRLDKLRTMTDRQVARAALNAHRAALKMHRDFINKTANLKAKYLAMLEKVNSWVPPTPNHAGLKKFMVDQIERSISFDCGIGDMQEPLLLHGSSWREFQIRECMKDIDYFTKKNDAEIEQCRKSTEWVRALRNSLRKASSK